VVVVNLVEEAKSVSKSLKISPPAFCKDKYMLDIDLIKKYGLTLNLVELIITDWENGTPFCIRAGEFNVRNIHDVFISYFKEERENAHYKYYNVPNIRRFNHLIAWVEEDASKKPHKKNTYEKNVYNF